MLELSRKRIRNQVSATLHSRRLLVESLEDRNLLSLSGNMLFPADNPWNQRVDSAPVAANSDTLVASIGLNANVHPDFGTTYMGAYIGIPFNVVSASQAPVEVVIDVWPGESDLGDVPIPPGAVIEGDPLPPSQNTGDRHLIVYDEDNNVAYELFKASRPSENPDNKWHAYNQAFWDFNQNWFRPDGYTSGDAAGLPILPGLVRPDEVLEQGAINHALRFTVPNSRNQYVYPASHHAGVNNANYPRMGERFRLKADFDISGFSPANQVILTALKEYGMIVADNGSPWFISGSPSPQWDDDDLHDLTDILGSNFEAVDLSPIVTDVSPDTGSTGGGTSVTIVGQNFSGAAGMLEVFFGTTEAADVTVVSDTMLVATTPGHAPGTVDVSVVTPYGTSAIVPGGKFTFTAGTGTEVAGRHLFYNQSKFDGGDPAASASDDGAIATDKSAYLPAGGIATFDSISSYSRGINGIMVDVQSPAGTLTTADFTFKMSEQTVANNTPSTWQAAPAPSDFAVRPGAGVDGSDRVTITWEAGAITNRWLEVIVEGNDVAGGFNTNTGLAASDVFFFGNRIGDAASGTSTLAVTNAVDEIAARNNPGFGAAITNLFDFDRSGLVSAVDNIIARNNAGTLTKINITDPPGAPDAELALAVTLAGGASDAIGSLSEPVDEYAIARVAKSRRGAASTAPWPALTDREMATRPAASSPAADDLLDDRLIDALLADLF
ncbi:MAG: hypothetical protein DWQ37_01195 [Planctomycetota bacterium]|nr:MAG: hypothetical protein DWQ37_01195 [Planctomycetota bacterium]